MIVILMGVSGVGKTTIGTQLAARLGWLFVDADDYHPAANKQKMASGRPLTDEDRRPWLDTLRAHIEAWIADGANVVLACSALKQIYRERLAGGTAAGQVRFAHLEASPELIAERLRARSHAFMNPGLLASQLNTLEAPQDAWNISVAGTPEEAVEALAARIKA